MFLGDSRPLSIPNKYTMVSSDNYKDVFVPDQMILEHEILFKNQKTNKFYLTVVIHS